MEVKGRRAGVEIVSMGERFGLGNVILGMCYIKIKGHKLSSLQKQGREGVGGQWGPPVLRGNSHYSAPCRGTG